MRNPSDPVSQGLDAENHLTLRLKFRVTTAKNQSIPGWEAVLWRGRLYISMSAKELNEGSKEAFVRMLEYAEEVLHCSHVLVCLSRHEPDLKDMARNFLFLGFQTLAPGHEFLPPNPNLVCFVYKT